jgi:hypothetical protein
LLRQPSGLMGALYFSLALIWFRLAGLEYS